MNMLQPTTHGIAWGFPFLKLPSYILLLSAHVSTYACNHVIYKILNIDWLIDMKDIYYNYAFVVSYLFKRSCLYVSLTSYNTLEGFALQ